MENDWKNSLSFDDKGNLTKSISNYRAIFTHDENLSQIRFDTFSQDDISFSPLFLNVNGNKVDEESVGKIQDYLEQTYQLRLTQNKVFELLKTTASERSYNPVQEFIRKEDWDGMPRIETAIIDYLGAEDTPLVREQTKLWFVAAVARAFEPGCKFDNVLTLPGPQGIGKSTFFKTIGDKWFNDSFSFASGDKEKVETITNGWIIEISELNGMKRANDAEAAKAFLSRRSDSMRPAYGRKVVEFLRHNVFAATTNETNFLQGDNGNRRWWIVTVNGNGHVSTWLPQLQSVVNQLWAEAYTYYRKGVKLYLSPELEAEANAVQLNHSSIHNDPILDDIRLYLERVVPTAYSTWSIPMRAAYQKGAYHQLCPLLGFPLRALSPAVGLQLVGGQGVHRLLCRFLGDGLGCLLPGKGKLLLQIRFFRPDCLQLTGEVVPLLPEPSDQLQLLFIGTTLLRQQLPQLSRFAEKLIDLIVVLAVDVFQILDHILFMKTMKGRAKILRGCHGNSSFLVLRIAYLGKLYHRIHRNTTIFPHKSPLFGNCPPRSQKIFTIDPFTK